MKRQRLLVLASLILTASLVGQVEHAPTFQSCNADLNLWTSQIPGFPTSNSEQDHEGTKSLTVHEMIDRATYLNDCAQAYPSFNKNRPGELSQLASLSL